MSRSTGCAAAFGLALTSLAMQPGASTARADSCFDRTVRPIIAETLDVKQKRVDRGASLRGLGASPDDKIELAERLEQAFGFEVRNREAYRWRTVEDVEITMCLGPRY